MMEFVLTVLVWAFIVIGGWYFTQANPIVKEKFHNSFPIILLFALIFVIFVLIASPLRN
tara:strand:- start:122 stop:298 length:177 start_codon:yes stop_codon:yes gene_type:complete